MSLTTVINLRVASASRFDLIMDAIRKALEDAGIEFIPENGGGLGVRFAKRRKSPKK